MFEKKESDLFNRMDINWHEGKRAVVGGPLQWEFESHYMNVLVDGVHIAVGVQSNLITDSDDEVDEPTLHISFLPLSSNMIGVLQLDAGWNVNSCNYSMTLTGRLHTNKIKRHVAKYLSEKTNPETRETSFSTAVEG